jgi:hypothetical protein
MPLCNIVESGDKYHLPTLNTLIYYNVQFMLVIREITPIKAYNFRTKSGICAKCLL